MKVYKADDFPFLDVEEYKELNNRFPNSVSVVSDKMYHGHDVLIEDVPIDKGVYNVDKVDLLIIVPNGYPMSKLDMFHIFPELERKDGQRLFIDSYEFHHKRRWQQWSVHYDWISGVHDINTHVNFAIGKINEYGSAKHTYELDVRMK